MIEVIPRMKLTRHEQLVLAGTAGEGARIALEYQVRLGEFYGAEHLVPVTNAHFTGDFEVMDQGGLDYLRHVQESGGKVSVPTTRNAACVDPLMAGHMRQRPELVDGEAQVGPLLARMGVMTVNTCINYQSVYVPAFGEHVAWGDTGTVAYANGVLGARTNFEAGPASIFAGITGRTPAYGFHLDENRKANIVCRVTAALDDLADWGALGKIIGSRFRGYDNVPVLEVGGAPVTPDALKHFAASLASYGSMAMFHVVGATPEAPTLADAVGGREQLGEITIRQQDLEDVYGGFDSGDGRVHLVVFTAPQLSLFEIGKIVDLLGDRRVHPDVQLIITTNHMVAKAAEDSGVLGALGSAGVTLIQGTCWYLMDPAEMQKQWGWNSVITNSAKLANIISAHNYRPVLRRTAECIEAAVAGKLVA
jgi:predicted aconitase